MKKVLIVCNTYYQLVVGMQLAITVYSEDSVDVLLSNVSANSDFVVGRLKEFSPFSNVYFIDAEALGRRNILEKTASTLWNFLILPPRLAGGPYSSIIFFNYTDIICQLCDRHEAEGIEVELIRMEEGLISCSSAHPGHKEFQSGTVRLRDKLRRARRRRNIQDSVSGFYTFVPALCDWDFPHRPLRIPPLSKTRAEIARMLLNVFDFHPFECAQKFIYFAANSFMDFHTDSERQTIERIADIVGRENLIVKKHPRDSSAYFNDNGFNVMSHSWVPWEVVQLCSNLADKTLLTMSSGAFLTTSALLDNQPGGFFVTPSNDFGTNPGDSRWMECMSVSIDMVGKLHSVGLAEDVSVIGVDDLETALGFDDREA